jgi:hypothetical protein
MCAYNACRDLSSSNQRLEPIPYAHSYTQTANGTSSHHPAPVNPKHQPLNSSLYYNNHSRVYDAARAAIYKSSRTIRSKEQETVIIRDNVEVEERVKQVVNVVYRVDGQNEKVRYPAS